MAEKIKYQLEYTFNSSARVLYNRISTAAGLAEWFAEDVNVKDGKTFFFKWDGSEEQAELLAQKDMKSARFKWLDDEDDEAYFEFKIEIDELTGDVALIITDFAEEDDKEDAINLWDSQISELRQVLGS
jgi:uncharacterized protein YndB with AHSA1/START domain